MIIRDAREDELFFIRKQRVSSYDEHAPRISDGHWQALRKGISSDSDVQQGVERIVAEVEGKIVGSVVLFPAKTDVYGGLVEEMDYPEIRMLAVTPEVRGKGVASALITECILRAKIKGFQAVGLHTGEFMEKAIRLYEHLGFERLPHLDFQLADDGIIVRAYRLGITE